MTPTVIMEVGDSVLIDPTDWEARAAVVRVCLEADGLPASLLAEALTGFTFLDHQERQWTFDGATWSWWDGEAWIDSAELPPSKLRMQPFTFEEIPDVDEAPRSALEPLEASTDLPEPATGDSWQATHRVSAGGTSAWAEPDPDAAPIAELPEDLEVRVLEQTDVGWAHVDCDNGWSGWVDLRALAAI